MKLLGDSRIAWTSMAALLAALLGVTVRTVLVIAGELFALRLPLSVNRTATAARLPLLAAPGYTVAASAGACFETRSAARPPAWVNATADAAGRARLSNIS